GQSHFGVDKFAVSGDWKGDPFGLRAIAALGDQIEAARLQAFTYEFFGNIADGHDAAAAENDALDFAGVMRETEHPAGRDQFCNLGGGQGKATVAQAKQDERLLVGFGDQGHCMMLVSGSSSAIRSAARLASASCDSDASIRKSSSGVRKPSGLTTGTTFWSRAVRPRYQVRSSWQKASGSACRRVMLVIFSMPSINSAVRVRRRTKTRDGGAGGKPKCMAAFTT